MIKKFGGFNISSSDPEELALFYNKVLGIPILTENPSIHGYDGVEIGFSLSEPRIWIWNEEKWGKSNFGAVTIVFFADNIEKTYEGIKKIDNSAKLTIAEWGGKELSIKDPDGNIVLILEG